MGKKALRLVGILKRPMALVCFVLVLGIALLYVWIKAVEPLLLSLPTDFSYNADVISYDDFFDQKTGSFTGPVRSSTTFGYKVIRSEGPIRIVQNTFDVHKPTGEKIISITRDYGINAQTWQHVAGYGDKNRQGYLFGPMGAEKKEFTYWQVNYDVPINMKFVADETIAGVQTAHYKAVFTADQTSSLTNLPDVGKTRGISTDVVLQLWIEPTSGHLVKYDDQAIAYYYDLATKTRLYPWNRFSNTYSFNSVATQARLAEQESQRVQRATVRAPALIVILMLSAAFGVAARRYRHQGIARLSTVTAIIIALSSLLFWYTAGLTLDLPEWLEPIYPGVSLGILILSWQFYRPKPKSNSPSKLYTSVLLVTSASFGFLALGELLNPTVINLHIPVAGGQESFALPIAAATIAIYALVTILKPATKIRAIAHARELLAVCAMLATLVSMIGYAYGDFVNLIRMPAAVALSIFGIGIFANEPDWLTTRLGRRLGKGIWIFTPTAVGLLVFTGLAWQFTQSITTQQTVLQFQSDINTMQNTIIDRLRFYTSALYGSQSLFAATNNVGRGEWGSYVDGLRIAENYPGTEGIGFAQVVPKDQLASHIASVRAQGFPAYTVWPLEPARDVYAPIVYIEPFDSSNQRAFGFDGLSEPARHDALERARDTGEAAMTGRVTLVQETTSTPQPGFVVYVPVFKKNMPLATVQNRRDALAGYVFSPFRINTFMQAVIGNLGNGIDIEIFDGTPQKLNNDTLMYSSSPQINTNSQFKATQTILADGHTWTVRFTGSSDYNNNLTQSLPSVILAGGILLSITLGIAIFGLSSSRQRAVIYAQSLTRDLATQRDLALKVQDNDEAILSSMAEGLIVLDRRGKIEKVNKAAITLLGYTSSKELIGNDLAATIVALGEDGRPIPPSARPITRVLEGGGALLDAKVQYLRKDSSRFWALISAAPITHWGHVTGAIELFRDVSAERELDKAKDDFLSVASHQLRTPITAERWYLDILQDESATDKLTNRQREIAQKIAKSNSRMSELVKALLNVTRAESGRMAVQPIPTNVGELIKDVIDELSVRLNQKHQQVVQDIQKTPVINVDPVLVRQVVVNLLTNASKYSPDKARIFVSLFREADHLVCTVRDEGYGIPADQQSRVFSKFFRADNAVRLVADGNGLGLYLVKTIVELSGGTISFESKESLGTTFRFTLPIADGRGQEGVVKLEEQKG